jgi:hypothetical protein
VVVENNAMDDDDDADADADADNGWLDTIKIMKNIVATKRRRDNMLSQYGYGLLLVDIAENE